MSTLAIERRAVRLGRAISILSAAGVVFIAGTLFLLNNLGLVSARLHPAPGTVPMSGFRITDLAIYETWMRAFQHSLLIPNFSIPEHTEPGFFNLLMFTIARLSNLVHLDPTTTALVVQALLYLVAASGVYAGLRIFLTDRRQRWLAVVLMVCSMPVPSLLILPRILLGQSWPLPGIGYFVWYTSDGFFHGIAGSVLVTFGTAVTLIAFGLLGAYLRDGNRRLLAGACVAVFAAGAVHANEAALIAAAACTTLLLRPPAQRSKALLDAFLLGGSAALGLLLLVIPALAHPWVRHIGQHSAGTPLAPLDVLVSIGLPALVCLALLPFSGVGNSQDILLKSWFVFSLVGVMLPLLPTPQHFLDGFHYATAILLTRLLTQKPAFRFVDAHRSLAMTALAAVCILSAGAYLRYCWQGYLDGSTLSPQRLFPAVRPREEADLLAWLRANADSNAIAVAPPENAAWVATLPMHTIGAHWLWSMDSEAPKQAVEFYRGNMGCDEAAAFLSRNHVRYVIVNADSAVRSCMPREFTAKFGSLVLYEPNLARAHSGGMLPDRGDH